MSKDAAKKQGIAIRDLAVHYGLHEVLHGISLDVEGGARFADAIARGSYPMSAAVRPGVRAHLFVREGGDYDIPYRCLVPRDVDGLLVAGRCLSATREAIGSARMGAQCMAYGEAAGTAAALAVERGVAPRAVDIVALRRALKEQRAIV